MKWLVSHCPASENGLDVTHILKVPFKIHFGGGLQRQFKKKIKNLSKYICIQQDKNKDTTSWAVNNRLWSEHKAINFLVFYNVAKKMTKDTEVASCLPHKWWRPEKIRAQSFIRWLSSPQLLSLLHCLSRSYRKQVVQASHTCGGVGVEEGRPTGGVEFLLPEPPAMISSVISRPPWLGSRIRIWEDNDTQRKQTSLKHPSLRATLPQYFTHFFPQQLN